MTPLDCTIHRLYERGYLAVVRQVERADINLYQYSYVGRLAEQRVTVAPNMTKETLRKLIGRALSGDLSEMATIAMLYNVGYGLPKDRDLSEAWAMFASMSPARVTFDEACNLLKRHWKECPDDIWPLDLTLPIARMATRLNRFKPFAGNVAGATILPRLMGIRVFLVYRQIEDGVPHLYAAYYKDPDGNQILDIDALIRLGAPRYLGEIRGKCIIDSYTPFGKHPMYVVVGTIAIPSSLHAKARRFGKSTRDVFDAFLKDDSVRKQRDAFDNTFFVDQLESLGKRLRSIEAKRKTVKGLRKLNLNAAYEETVKKHSELEAALKASDPDTEYANYLESLPETYLKLITHELYLWKNKEFEAAPIPPSQTPAHLSSLGFTSMRYSQLEVIGYSTDKRLDAAKLHALIEKFESVLGFRLTGLIIQPKSKTAQLRSCRIFTK